MADAIGRPARKLDADMAELATQMVYIPRHLSRTPAGAVEDVVGHWREIESLDDLTPDDREAYLRHGAETGLPPPPERAPGFEGQAQDRMAYWGKLRDEAVGDEAKRKVERKARRRGFKLNPDTPVRWDVPRGRLSNPSGRPSADLPTKPVHSGYSGYAYAPTRKDISKPVVVKTLARMTAPYVRKRLIEDMAANGYSPTNVVRTTTGKTIITFVR